MKETFKIKFLCNACNKTSNIAGSILYGPPDKYGKSEKFHICVGCFQTMKEKFSNQEISIDKKGSVYGYCPFCGAPGITRERCPNGNDTCENGHKYLSSTALAR